MVIDERKDGMLNERKSVLEKQAKFWPNRLKVLVRGVWDVRGMRI